MAKQKPIEQDGVVVESLSNAMFKVKLDNEHIIIAHISWKSPSTTYKKNVWKKHIN